MTRSNADTIAASAGIGRFVVVFNSIEDPTHAQASTIFAAMARLDVRVLDRSIPGNVLVEGCEEDVAAMLVDFKEWSYAPVAWLAPAAAAA